MIQDTVTVSHSEFDVLMKESEDKNLYLPHVITQNYANIVICERTLWVLKILADMRKIKINFHRRKM